MTKAMVAALPYPAVVLLEDGAVIAVNGAWETLAEAADGDSATSAWPREGSSVGKLSATLGGSDERAVYEGVQGVLTGRLERFGFDSLHPVGRSFRVHVLPLDLASNARGAVVSLLETTALRRTEAALRESRAAYRTMFDLPNVGRAQIELATGRFSEVNSSLCDLLGYTGENLRSMTLISLVHPEDKGAVGKALERLRRGDSPSHSAEVRCVGRDGEIVWTAVNLWAVQGETGEVQGVAATFGDITDRKHYENEIRRLAYTDTLTGLNNRYFFFEQGRRMLAAGRRYGRRLHLLYIDLDGFKEVNDAFGHAAGDYVLIKVAARFKEQARKSDLLARLGGDEFAILLENGEEDADVRAAERILTCLREPFLVAGHEVEVGASIGIASYPLHGDDIQPLLKEADNAMYRAKRRGGGLEVNN